MKKILLINPPLFFHRGEPKSLDVSAPPLGALCLVSYIKKYSTDFEAEMIDVGAEKINLEKIIRRIIQSSPFVISISAMTPQLQGAVELARSIKKSSEIKAKIFLGGPHISADSGFIDRRKGLFDYAITGEAEKTFLDSLNKLAKGIAVARIQSGQAIENLDEIPFPDRRLIKRTGYNPVESMMFSRGCPFRCYYCSRPSVSRKVRYRSAKNLIEEIKLCQAQGTKEINFQDDTFTLDRAKVAEFCNGIISQGIKINWHCNTRIDLVDEELLALMKRAGCKQINFGIESGSERVRKDVIHKGNFSNADIFKVFELCKKNKIKIACYFMMGHPTETEDEIQETKKMILNSGIDILGLSLPLPFPGSELYEIAKSEGIINEEIIDKFAAGELGEGYAGVYPEYISKTLKADYIHSQMREINRRFYFTPKMIITRIKHDIFHPVSLKSDLKDFLSLICRGVSSRKPYIKK